MSLVRSQAGAHSYINTITLPYTKSQITIMKSTKLQKISYNPYDNMSKGIIVLRTLVESIPFGLGPYGIGDAISLYEAINGKMIFGPRLDTLDRIISLIASLLPIVPATPFRLTASKLRARVTI